MAKQSNNNKNQKKTDRKNNRNVKGGKPPYRSYSGDKQERRGEEAADTAMKMSRGNPISLYTLFDQFVHDAANLPFTRVVGNVYNVNILDGLDPTPTVHQFTTADPGLMRIVFSPTVGVSANYVSPLNRSSINFYGRLRATQRAFGDYDHQDLTMMVMAIDSLIMFHALARKIYAVANEMTPINRYYPKALVAACGMNFDDLQKNLQNFRSWINEFGLLITQYTLPDNVRLIRRHQWMCEGLYTDSMSRRAQTYCFVPAGFWKYNSTAEKGSQLDYVQYVQPGETSVTLYTVAEFMEMGNSLMRAISNDADFATISGDLYAYYGGQRMVLPYVEEKYGILPSYDTTVLSQIENATIMGWWASNYTPVISQNPDVNQGAIIFEPVMGSSGSYHRPTSLAMNFHKDSPTQDDIIEATRLMAMIAPVPTNNEEYPLAICGSEIVHCMDIFVTNPATMGIRTRRIQQPVHAFAAGTTIAEYQNMFGDLVWLQKFDWAPRVFVINHANQVLVGDSWDVDNSANIASWQLDDIMTACLYSLFNVDTK